AGEGGGADGREGGGGRGGEREGWHGGAWAWGRGRWGSAPAGAATGVVTSIMASRLVELRTCHSHAYRFETPSSASVSRSSAARNASSGTRGKGVPSTMRLTASVPSNVSRGVATG